MDDMKPRCIWCRYSRYWYRGRFCIRPENYLQNGNPATVAEDDACRLFEREPGADDDRR